MGPSVATVGYFLGCAVLILTFLVFGSLMGYFWVVRPIIRNWLRPSPTPPVQEKVYCINCENYRCNSKGEKCVGSFNTSEKIVKDDYLLKLTEYTPMKNPSELNANNNCTHYWEV